MTKVQAIRAEIDMYKNMQYHLELIITRLEKECDVQFREDKATSERGADVVSPAG